MGGAAAHMKNVWEVREFSFQDLKDLISDSLSGKIEKISEKLDGQNLMVTWKDNELKAARNKGHLKNRGETSLNIEQMKKFFEGRGYIYDTFVESMIWMQNSFINSKLNLNKIFKNGKNWLNIEIIYKPTKNIIPYDDNQIRMHYFRRINKNGEVIKIHNNKLDKLNKKIKYNKDSLFFIDKTNSIIIDYIIDYKKIIKELQDILTRFEIEKGINPNNTIQNYIDSELKLHITNFFSTLENFDYNISISLRDKFIKRWGYSIKNPNINILLKEINDKKIIDWFKKEDKQIDKLIKRWILPIEIVFLKLGTIILNNLYGIISLNPNETKEKIKFKVKKALKEFEKEDSLKIKEFLDIHLEKFIKSGGYDFIAPTEGIVFNYKKKLIKLTGNFGAINQLVNFLKFKRV